MFNLDTVWPIRCDRGRIFHTLLVPHYTFPAHIILFQRRVHIPDIQVTAGDVHAVVPRSHLQQHPLQGRPFRAHAANHVKKHKSEKID